MIWKICSACEALQFKTSGSRSRVLSKNYALPRKGKLELVPETESDHESIAADSTRTPRRSVGLGSQFLSRAALRVRNYEMDGGQGK